MFWLLNGIVFFDVFWVILVGNLVWNYVLNCMLGWGCLGRRKRGKRKEYYFILELESGGFVRLKFSIFNFF